MLVINANAESFTVGKLKFWLNDDGVSVHLQGTATGEPLTGDLIIPSTINYEDRDYTIVGISNSAFKNNTGLTSVTIPNTVTMIWSSAFQGCTNLKEIYFPNAINHLGNNVFYKTAWYDSQPDGVVYAGSVLYAYKNAKAMPQNTNIVIQDGTTCIAEKAFYECTNLKSIQIPNTVRTISDNAFNGCTALTSVNVPSSVRVMGVNTFRNCTSLVDVTLPNTITLLNGGMFQNCKSLTSITIPNSVKYIGASAFNGCSGLTSISIPNSVTGIGGWAFAGCTNLAEISVPSSVIDMREEVFYKTAWYDSQPDGVLYAGTIALGYKGEMPSGLFTIKDGTTAIAGVAFKDCTGITLLRLPSSLKYINIQAFYNCSNMSVLTIPNNVKAIGYQAFYNCSNLTEITFPNSLVKVGQSAFIGTTWYNSQPDGVMYAGPVALSYKGNMPDNKTLTIKEGTKGIADYAFDGKSFYNVILPNSLTRIGQRSFQNMYYLQEINIPQSVTSIDEAAFFSLRNLQRVDAYVDPAKVTMGYDDIAFREPSANISNRLSYCLVFSNYMDGRTLHVLPGKEDSFKNSLCWALFRNIVGDLGLGGLKGDVNGDGKVDIEDVNAAINIILDLKQPTDYTGNADLNGDGKVDIEDVNAIINIILTQ